MEAYAIPPLLPPARAQDQSLRVRQRNRSGRVTGRVAEENLASMWLALQTDRPCPLCPSLPALSATVRKSSFRAIGQVLACLHAP